METGVLERLLHESQRIPGLRVMKNGTYCSIGLNFRRSEYYDMGTQLDGQLAQGKDDVETL